MKHIRIGVIGLGRMGQRHCRIYSNLRRVELAGVHDIDPERGAATSKQYDVPFYSNLHDLLANVDAVSIATPTSFHYEQTITCIQSGVHALVEKPLTQTLEQARELVSLSEKIGLSVQVGHIERFNPAFLELANLLETMQPIAFNFQRLSPSHGSNLDVDVILDLMIHDLNLLLTLVEKPPLDINVMGLSVLDQLFDFATAMIRFENGPVVCLTASRVTEQKIRQIDVTCKDAYMECDLLNKSISIYRSTVHDFLPSNSKGSKYRQESIVEKISVPTFEPLFLELQHFVECILDKKAPLVTPKDGYEALEFAMSIRDRVVPTMIHWR